MIEPKDLSSINSTYTPQGCRGASCRFRLCAGFQGKSWFPASGSFRESDPPPPPPPPPPSPPPPPPGLAGSQHDTLARDAPRKALRFLNNPPGFQNQREEGGVKSWGEGGEQESRCSRGTANNSPLGTGPYGFARTPRDSELDVSMYVKLQWNDPRLRWCPDKYCRSL